MKLNNLKRKEVVHGNLSVPVHNFLYQETERL